MTVHSPSPVRIADTTIQPIICRDQPVLTLAMMDQIHQRPKGTAGRTFRENRKRLLEGEDWMEISPDEIRTTNPNALSEAIRSKLIVVTESGYLLLVKSFTDDLAWGIQRQLVSMYFRINCKVEAAPQPQLPDSISLELRRERLGQRLQDTLDARSLHRLLGNKRHYSDWIKQRLSRYPFVEQQDFVSYSQPSDHPRGGRPSQEYQISVDMAKTLCIIESTAKGWETYHSLCERMGTVDDDETRSPTIAHQLSHLIQQLEHLNHRLSHSSPEPVASDILQQRLAAWLAGRQQCTLAEISAALFDMPLENLSCLGQMRIRCLLQDLGWQSGCNGGFKPSSVAFGV